MDYEELKDFFQDGIVTDLMYAIRHYFIWRTIGENFNEISKVEIRSFNKLMGEIQSSSHDLAIIRLSKIYDNNSNRYQIRSFFEILNLDLSNSRNFPLYTNFYKEFTQINELFPNIVLPEKLNSTVEFFEFFKSIINEDFFRNKVNNIKFIRDKTIAHNEHNVSKYGFKGLKFWDDYSIILDFTKSFIYLFGMTFLGSHYFQFSYERKNEIHYSILMDMYWLVEEIESKVGKDQFVQWWV